MTSTARRRGLRSRAVRGLALAGAGLLLTGCGAARPGVAAQVGEETITLSEVDAAAIDVCKGLATIQPGTVVPMRLARDVVLISEINRRIGDQVADEYGVSPGTDYEKQVADLRTQLSALPSDQLQAFLDLQTGGVFRDAITTAAARLSLQRDGVGSPTAQQISDRAVDLGMSWTDTHDIVIDPRFAVAIKDGAPDQVQGGSAVSVALSETATLGLENDPANLESYLRTLPASQRCGG